MLQNDRTNRPSNDPKGSRLIVSLSGRDRRELSYDVAVYGAGPAGISLTRALSGTGLRIGLFEAGGLEPPPLGPDHPYRGQNKGLPYDVAATRLRYLGGTSNHWGGWCRPLDPFDFSVREHIPLSGWPISRDDLDPYFESALEVCEVETGGLGLPAFERDFDYEGFVHRLVPSLEVKNFLFSPPTRFGSRYREDLSNADDVECFLDATLVRLVGPGDEIDKASVLSSTGGRAHVSAGCHVLAMGAVENARMLLHSGIANRTGFVGRCFSDHLGHTVGIALLDFDNRYLLHHARHGVGHLRVLPHLSLSDDAMREHRLANFGIVLDARGRTSLDQHGRAVKSQLDRWRPRSTRALRLLVRMENTPNPGSRITLADDTDAYGVPRVVLDWRVNPFDLEYLERLCGVLGQEIGRAGGRVRIDYSLARARTRPGSYQAHHMGTTRMSAHPEEGVVNANLRCHDVSNLYVAGSSVFPTFGFANPTLTIVALSLRLARHLRHGMGRPDAGPDLEPS